MAVAAVLVAIVVARRSAVLARRRVARAPRATAPRRRHADRVRLTGTTALTQQQAATALSGLLSQSGTDHSDVNAAVTNVESCGKSLTARTRRSFNKAAANRRTLLTKLAQLPGRSALPAAMISDLTTAWQASATVDADLAKWATAEAGHCRRMT